MNFDFETDRVYCGFDDDEFYIEAFGNYIQCSFKYFEQCIQSALVISNSKGLSEIHRDIRTLTYQISKIEKINSNSQVPQIHM